MWVTLNGAHKVLGQACTSFAGSVSIVSLFNLQAFHSRGHEQQAGTVTKDVVTKNVVTKHVVTKGAVTQAVHSGSGWTIVLNERSTSSQVLMRSPAPV